MDSNTSCRDRVGSRGIRPILRLALPGVLLAALACSAAPSAKPAPDKPAPLRALLASAEFGWVADSALLDLKLALAARLGYNAFICHFEPPAPGPDSAPNWRRSPETGNRWSLVAGDRDGHPGPRETFIARIRMASQVAEKHGMEFIPDIGAMGWGANYFRIDPTTLAGDYYELDIAARPENLFVVGSATAAGAAAHPGKNLPPALTRNPGWGDSLGSLVLHSGDSTARDSSDLSRIGIRMRGAGRFAAQFKLSAPWDAYFRCRLPVTARSPSRDSAALRVYEFNGWEYHPYSTKLLAGTAAPLPGGKVVLEVAFFARKGRTYLLDLEYACRAATGGSLDLTGGSLARALPPRSLLLDTSSAPAGAWAGLSSFQGTLKGTFMDLDPEAYRLPVDPLSPPAREITAALMDAAAEALGRRPRLMHLGGDENFSLHRSRIQNQPPYAGMSASRLYAGLLRSRMDQADSVLGGRFPGAKDGTAYIVYGDMFTTMNGGRSGTWDAADSLAAPQPGMGKPIVMPWYYATQIRGIPFGARDFRPGGPRPAGFLRLLREDARRLSRLGLDFVGLYSTDGDVATFQEQIKGAEMWNQVCGEFSSGPGGRCLGLAYCGWDTTLTADWGRNYNGLVMLARGWSPAAGAGALADKDGDGVVDLLRPVPPGR